MEIRVGRKDFVLLTCLAYSLLYDPLYFYITHFDGARRSISVAFTFGLLYYLASVRRGWKTFLRTPTVFWLMWVIYNFFNTIFHGINEAKLSFSSLAQQLLLPLVGFILAINVVDKLKLLKTIFICGIIYIVMFLVFDKPNQGDIYRLGASINSNEAGWILILTFLCGLMLFNKRGISIFIIMSTLVLIITFLLGSRKTFIVFGFIAISYFLIIYGLPKRFIFRIILVIILGGYLWSNIITDTHLGSRLLITLNENKTVKDPEQRFSNRGYFYVMGLEIFNKEPITGIGLENFTKKTQTEERIHSEYMVNLTEGGIISSALFLLFYFFLTRNIITQLEEKEIKKIKVISILSFFFIFLGRWNYDHIQSFVFLGAILIISDRGNYESEQFEQKI